MPSASEPTPDLPSERDPHDRPAHRESRPHRPARRPGRPRNRPRTPRTDLEILGSEPSLASLSGLGWHLDGLPTTSVGLAFAGTLGTALFAFGPLGATLVIVGMAVFWLLAASAVLMRDVPAARATLRIARISLLVGLLASAAHL